MHARTPTCTLTHTHTRMHARVHTHTHRGCTIILSKCQLHLPSIAFSITWLRWPIRNAASAELEISFVCTRLWSLTVAWEHSCDKKQNIQLGKHKATTLDLSKVKSQGHHPWKIQGQKSRSPPMENPRSKDKSQLKLSKVKSKDYHLCVIKGQN